MSSETPRTKSKFVKDSGLSSSTHFAEAMNLYPTHTISPVDVSTALMLSPIEWVASTGYPSRFTTPEEKTYDYDALNVDGEGPHEDGARELGDSVQGRPTTPPKPPTPQ